MTVLSGAFIGLGGVSSQATAFDRYPAKINNQMTSSDSDRIFNPAQGRVRTIPVKTNRAFPEKPEKGQFLLKDVIVEGATVYQTSDFLPLYRNFLNQKVTLANMNQIASAIADKYRQDGYIFTRAFIPSQKIHQGVARVMIDEGFREDFVIEGNVRGPKIFMQDAGTGIQLH